MNKEELFCKLFPEYAVNGKPLSPYFDFFESGYEQAENRIEELEATNKRISDECHKLVDSLEKKQKENAELKKNYEDSLIACGVLKAKVDTLAQPSPLESMQDILITTQEVAYEKQKKQLTNAKEIIKKYLTIGVGGKITKNYLDVTKEAEQFLKEE